MSEDPSQVDTETLVRSRDRDLDKAAASKTEAERLPWLQQALYTQWELARREARKETP